MVSQPRDGIHRHFSHFRRPGPVVGLLLLFGSTFGAKASFAAGVPGSPRLASAFLSSGGVETGRFEEVERACRSMPKRFGGRLRCQPFGTTPEGRRLLVFVASADGVNTPAKARAKRRPVVLAIGGIHAGEVDGKDAGLLLVDELLTTSDAVLRGVTFVFVPVLNVDGHERRARWNRPNQDGPLETGFRTTAANLNLNRDFMKADAPETRALLSLVNDWDPAVLLDLHVTDGADFPADLAVIVKPHGTGPAAIESFGDGLREAMLTGLSSGGFKPLRYYPTFRVDDDPASGVDDGAPPPRFSHAYLSWRNRIGVLVEAHSWKPFARRVYATRRALREALTWVAGNGKPLLEAVARVDEAQRSLVGTTLELAHVVDRSKGRTLPFESYGIRYEESPVLGTRVIRYDRDVLQTIELPYSDVLTPTVVETLPEAYVVPSARAAEVAQRLKAHGIRFAALRRPLAGLAVQRFDVTKSTLAAHSFEGRQRLEVAGAWGPVTLDLPAASLVIPVRQERARVIAALFEPRSPESFTAWGFFNAHFEQKEYLERYVADAAARTLFEDPALKAEFDRALADPAFAGSPEKRLDFVYRHHPSHDDRREVAPVFRVLPGTPAVDVLARAVGAPIARALAVSPSR